MIERYTRPQMKAIWDLKHKYEIWLEVELQACAAFEHAKQAPRGTAAKIRKKAKPHVNRIAEIEKVTKHDVIAFSNRSWTQLDRNIGFSTWDSHPPTLSILHWPFK